MTPDLVWPGAWRGRVASATVVVGDVDEVVSSLPRSTAGDLADAGRRGGEQLRLFLRRRGLLRTLAAQHLEVEADTVAIVYDAQGAPLARLGSLPPSRPLFVSLAARERIAAFALAARPVGIDIEPLHDPGPLPAGLTIAERAALAVAPEGQRPFETLKLWTAKEAYLKRLGLGLRRDPAEIEVGCGADDTRFAVRDAALGPRRVAAGQGCWLGLRVHGAELVVAIFHAEA